MIVARPAHRRLSTALGGGALCLLATLYWLGVAQRWPGQAVRFQVMLAALAVVVVVLVGAILAAPHRTPIRDLMRAVALALGLFAAGGPVLLNVWVRGGDFERYAWIIRQGFPCNTMGGGPGSLWVVATSWLFAVGGLIIAWSGGAPSRRALISGLTGGTAPLAVTAVAMFPRPEVFATLLGCR